MRLIIATKNNGKLKEIKKILAPVKIPIISLAKLKKKFRIVENGKTFLENAIKKTLLISRAYKNDYVVGEDSGLEVDYLNGNPGVLSRRYCGAGSTDLGNNKRIIKDLAIVTKQKRSCRFRCVLVLMKNGKLIEAFQGNLEGLVSNTIVGVGGFGYDPIFYLPKYNKTVAQISLALKNKISHRAQAFKQLKSYLRKIASKN